MEWSGVEGNGKVLGREGGREGSGSVGRKAEWGRREGELELKLEMEMEVEVEMEWEGELE
jgi:hypothetical protein